MNVIVDMPDSLEDNRDVKRQMSLQLEPLQQERKRSSRTLVGSDSEATHFKFWHPAFDVSSHPVTDRESVGSV